MRAATQPSTSPSVARLPDTPSTSLPPSARHHVQPASLHSEVQLIRSTTSEWTSTSSSISSWENPLLPAAGQECNLDILFRLPTCFKVASGLSLGHGVKTKTLPDREGRVHHPPVQRIRSIVGGLPSAAFIGGELIADPPSPPRVLQRGERHSVGSRIQQSPREPQSHGDKDRTRFSTTPGSPGFVHRRFSSGSRSV